jgi:hypothetical protein
MEKKMKKITKFITTFCLAMLAVMPSLATASCRSDCRVSHCKDPIVGPWCASLSLNGVSFYGVVLFHDDGTFAMHHTLGLTQAFNEQPFGVIGTFFTVEEGKWKRIGQYEYAIEGTYVALVRNPDCLPDPARPAYRVKDTFQNFAIDPCGQKASAIIKVEGYAVDDLTLSYPLFPTPATVPIQLQRLNF